MFHVTLIFNYTQRRKHLIPLLCLIIGEIVTYSIHEKQIKYERLGDVQKKKDHHHKAPFPLASTLFEFAMRDTNSIGMK